MRKLLLSLDKNLTKPFLKQGAKIANTAKELAEKVIFKLIEKMLILDPHARISIDEAHDNSSLFII